ncbi:glycosyl hydrolase family 95 catalytic domain-containing protein [Chitinophaga eiseniae]|uniref:Glycosyl hydrolase family 95 catalytic domain-containing protein n=1 Tax=Chitinophaga eiseniae TaxID=634771 RepID=A0A847S8V5_9BACT|nr:hypothetical protein [Chitinophaga eiseniae]NLR79660.1 hypothetical protein [Chitinophaga eiseniae]
MNRILIQKRLVIAFICFLFPIQLFSQAIFIPPYKNIWTSAPRNIPTQFSTDAPLMGNGDLLATLGYQHDSLRFYISKTDFGRWESRYGHGKKEADVAGSRLVAYLDIIFHNTGKGPQTGDQSFSASQDIWNGETSARIGQNISVTSWVCATKNLIFIKVDALKQNGTVSVKLGAPENETAKLSDGQSKSIIWQTRSFDDHVDIPASASIAMKTINYDTPSQLLIKKGQPLFLAIAVESNFKQKNPLEYVKNSISGFTQKSIPPFLQQHNAWWKRYWQQSNVLLNDSVLMKSYYQGLYTMGACSRDVNFPPGIFGWISSDAPAWNNDYHLNYNFEAPFYALYAANRLEQALPYDAPILAFMPRGKWYAEHVTHTRGILYPVGIGPLGVEVTRQVDTFYTHLHPEGIEKGGMFWQQRSNAAYALLNLGQYWYSTYDTSYAKKIYPYARSVAEFWEDYLKFEEGRYVIYNDAIHEGSGHDINPILSLGLVRSVFNLMIDLSHYLHVNEKEMVKWESILSHISQFPLQTRNGRTVFRYTEKGKDWHPDNGLGIQHIYPANAITLDSDTALLSISRNTIDEMKRWKDYNTSSSFFMAAIRVGYNPDTIYSKLHDFVANTRPNGFINNNVHGVENSCVVTNAVDEMLCMSVGNVIRLFPSLPPQIDASFNNLRANGAFLVSAKRKAGNISDVEIISERGRHLTIVNPWGSKQVKLLRAGKPAELLNGTRFTISTEAGEKIKIMPE